MFSVNFNEEEKKKRRADDSAFADSGSNMFAAAGVPFRGE